MKKITCLFVLIAALGLHSLWAQTRLITGTVTSADDNAPLPGVTIVVKGTSVGAISNADGNYQIEVPLDAEILEFSFVGMRTQNVSIENRTVINMALETELVGLEEVVVTAIGISRAQKALGYSVANVSSEETLQKSEPDLLRSMQGKVPGVDIRGNSGVPGAASRITIRGTTSFLLDNEPLFVVDGIPYSNPEYNTTEQEIGGGAYGSGIATLDPNNIENINILKGAAAAALYGSRAKNGVIMITTKSGSAGASKKGLEVTVNSSVNWEKISNLPEYQNTYGNGVDFDYQNANGSWGPRFDQLDSIALWGQYAAAFPDLPRRIPYVAQPDNVKDLFETGIVVENSINFTGGTDKSSFSITASQLNNDGYIPFSEFNRTSLSAGGVTKLSNHITATANFSYSTSKQVGGIFGNNQASDDNAASSFARTLWMGRTWDITLPYTDPVTGGPINWNGNQQYDHPLWSWEHNKVTTDLDRIVGNIKLSYDLTDWLNLSYLAGVNTLVQRRQQVIDKYSRGYAGDGAIIDDDVWRQEIESNLLLTINRQISSDFDITAIVGHNVNQITEDRQGFLGRTIISSDIYDLDNTQSVIPYGGDYFKRRIIGVFTDLTLGYRGYLFVNLTGRNDWSSTLPKNKNNYFYPAVAGSFVFTEAFNIRNSTLSFGKLRASWGKVGYDAPPYSTKDVFIVKNQDSPVGVFHVPSFPFLGQSALVTPSTSYDPDLKPEFKTEFEVGTNIGLFMNRINLDLTFYKNNSTDIITPVEVAGSSGYGLWFTNVGKMQNKGVEIGLNLVPVKTKSNLEWSIYTVFTKNKNEVIDIFEGDPPDGEPERTVVNALFSDLSPYVQVGEPYGVFLGTVNSRDDEGNLLIDPSSGQFIRDLEQQIVGDPNPDYKLAVTNTFSFKGLSLRVLVDYTHGGDVYSNSIQSLLGRGVTKDTEDREHNFILPGYYGDPNTYEPMLDDDGNKVVNITQVSMNDLWFGESFGMNSAAEWAVFDATVVRLREVSLGYEVPARLLSRTPFGSLSISFSGRNLWFHAFNMPEYTNFDPEISGFGSDNTQGIEYTTAPSVRRYGVNLRVTF